MPRPSRRASKSIQSMDPHGDRIRRSKHDDSSEEEPEDPTPQIKYPRTGKRGAPQVFPRKLYEILQNESEDVIAWTDSGKSFVIKDMEVFVTHVLMKYFRHQKYSSFQRQLNLYGFRKISKGAETGAYCHESFLKDQHDKLRFVRRTPQASSRSAPSKEASRESSRRPCQQVTKAARAALTRFMSSEDGIPHALPTRPVVAWRIDENGKKVHTTQPQSDMMDAHCVEAVPARPANAAAELDKLENQLLPDVEEDIGVLEGRALTKSPITLQPGLNVFDSKLEEDEKDLALAVSQELNELSSSVHKLVIETNDPFELPQFQSTASTSLPDDAYLLDLVDATQNTPMETETRDASRGRFRSLSMSSDDWPIPQSVDQLGPLDTFFSDSTAASQMPPVPVTMER